MPLISLVAPSSLRQQLWRTLCFALASVPSRADPLLFAAARDNDLPVVKSLLANGADPNYVFSMPLGRSTGATPLMVAAAFGRDAVVAQLLDVGATLDSEADDGLTALRFATQQNHSSTVELLLQAGADIDGTERSGNPLTIASQLGFDAVAEVLLDAGADANAYTPAPIDGVPLLMATSKGHVGIVRRLLDAGANVGLENSRGVSALMGIVLDPVGHKGVTDRGNALEVMQVLLEAGAPSSAVEEAVLARKCEGPTARCDALEMLRAWRQREKDAMGFPIVQWLKARAWYVPLGLGVMLWRRLRQSQAQRPGAPRRGTADRSD